MTESSRQALAILRDPSQFQWYVIPLLALTVYVYAVEIERKSWSLVFAGLAFWGMDWFNELWNALVFHFTRGGAAARRGSSSCSATSRSSSSPTGCTTCPPCAPRCAP